MNRPHYSYSQLAQYLRCPLQYFFERVVRLPRPFATSSLVLGAAVHEALASYHRSLQRQKPLSAHVIGDVFLTAWRRRHQEQPVRFGGDESTAALVDLGVALVEAYLAEPPPENILAVERSIVVPLETTSGVYLERPLVTVVDLLCRGEDAVTVVEIKTSRRRYSQAEVDASLQASCYIGATSTYFGQPARLDYRVLVKNRSPQLQRLVATRTHTDLRRVADIARAVGRGIAEGVFYPNESPLNCGGCPYRSQCRQWPATKRPVAPQTTAAGLPTPSSATHLATTAIEGPLTAEASPC